MLDICCIGHITSDKIVNAGNVTFMPGGTAFYFSHALSKLPVNYQLVTALGSEEMNYVDDLRSAGISILVQPSAFTVCFENIYDPTDPDKRTQRVSQTADAFTQEILENVKAEIFHLGPLLAGDVSSQLIQWLSAKGKISVDVQGYLRRVENEQVHAANWLDQACALPYIHTLKADVAELKALTGLDGVAAGVEKLAEYGVKEVIITNGSKGSTIWHNEIFYEIPAYIPLQVKDATGCGDTYMAGYLYKRVKGASVTEAGHFAAAMAGLKTANSGAFTGAEADVISFSPLTY